jgi:hypothetical protein
MATHKSGKQSFKPKEVAGTVRRSQVLNSYGPGALVDLLDHSVMIDGTGHWKAAKSEPLYDERLLSAVQARLKSVVTLNAETPFKLPPVPDDTAQNHTTAQAGLTATVFPEWMQCKQCHALAHRRDFAFKKKTGGRGYYQHECGPNYAKPGFAVPVRFVAACENGHIDDVDWQYYVHHNTGLPREQYRTHSLRLLESGSGDLAGVVVECTVCNASRSILDALATNQPTLGRCQGRRRWLGLGAAHNETCDKPLRLTVRTASDVWSPKVVSVLRLPAKFPERLQVHLDALVALMKQFDADDREDTLDKRLKKLELSDQDRAQLRDAVLLVMRGGEAPTDEVRPPEYERFATAPAWQASRQTKDGEFLVERVQQMPQIPGIDLVVTAHRLTEFRALCGFTRLNTSALGSSAGEKIQPICEDGGWLPAVRVFGEGVFVRLDSCAVADWEARAAVRARQSEFEKAWSDAGEFPGMAFILLHSLSHLLIQALSLRCGYSASALRERLYVGTQPHPYYAVLIHTGAPGVDGTLGGLADESNRIAEHLISAYHQARLCSNDPVCGSHKPGVGEGTQKLDGAACHSCLYISESSCERFNRGLDRALVFPVLGQPRELAFFSKFAAQHDISDDLFA